MKILLNFVSKGPIDKKASPVQIMTWRRKGNKQLHEPMMTQVNEAYMRHPASVSSYIKNTW